MPLLNSVTTPYAEALLQVVNENSQTEEMGKFEQFSDLLRSRSKLRLLLGLARN